MKACVPYLKTGSIMDRFFYETKKAGGYNPAGLYFLDLS